jgi:hypothetical protein
MCVRPYVLNLPCRAKPLPEQLIPILKARLPPSPQHECIGVVRYSADAIRLAGAGNVRTNKERSIRDYLRIVAPRTSRHWRAVI